MTTALDELITHYEESTASSAPESRFELAELRRSLEAAESRAAALEDTLQKQLDIRSNLVIEVNGLRGTLDELTASAERDAVSTVRRREGDEKMTYRVIATEIVDDTDRVVFNALDNKLIRRKLCQEMNRAEAAEKRAASKSELIDTIIATWEQMTERLLDSEARAAQLETDNDEMQSYINEIRVALHTEKDELTIEAVRRVISERDELARKLEQAQQALRSIEDQAGRAALVQDRSVSIIKQTCKIIADKAKAAMAA